MNRLGLFWKTVSTSGKIPGYAPVDILSSEGYVPASKRELRLIKGTSSR